MRFTDDQLVRQTGAKIGRPLYGVVVRTVGLSCQAGRAMEINRGMLGALGVHSDPSSNEIICHPAPKYEIVQFFFDVVYRQARRSGMQYRSPDAKLVLLTGAQFTEQYCDALRQAVPGLRVQIVKDLKIKVVDPDGKESGGFVGNAYDHYKSAPEHKAEIIQKYVAGFSESLTVAGCQIDTSRIVPILKDRAWIDGVNAGLRAAGMEKSFENIHDAY